MLMKEIISARLDETILDAIAYEPHRPKSSYLLES